MMFIYVIENKINGKQYVGQTVHTIEHRWYGHLHRPGKCSYIDRSIKKYGKENFEIKQIDKAISIEDLNTKEKYWIKELDTLAPYGYNLMTGGNNSRHSDETKRLRSKQTKLLWRNSIYREKVIESHIGNSYKLGSKLSENSRYNVHQAILKRPKKLRSIIAKRAALAGVEKRRKNPELYRVYCTKLSEAAKSRGGRV